jgi:hypothetical protein
MVHGEVHSASTTSATVSDQLEPQSSIDAIAARLSDTMSAWVTGAAFTPLLLLLLLLAVDGAAPATAAVLALLDGAAGRTDVVGGGGGGGDVDDAPASTPDGREAVFVRTTAPPPLLVPALLGFLAPHRCSTAPAAASTAVAVGVATPAASRHAAIASPRSWRVTPLGSATTAMT